MTCDNKARGNNADNPGVLKSISITCRCDAPGAFQGTFRQFFERRAGFQQARLGLLGLSEHNSKR